MGRRKRKQEAGAVNHKKRGRNAQPQDEEYEPSESSTGDGDSSETDLDDNFFAVVIENAENSLFKSRGPYEKNSWQTLARRKKHSQAFSQPIARFFPTIPKEDNFSNQNADEREDSEKGDLPSVDHIAVRGNVSNTISQIYFA
jgi:hypothetical protein